MTLVELCAGTAALSYHLCGAKRLTPYMGNKLRYAPQIAKVADLSRPDRVVLFDTGEWARTLGLLHAGAWYDVAAVLDNWGAARKALEGTPEYLTATCDRETYERLRSVPVASDPVYRAAAHLFLQCRSYNGKPVSVAAGAWVDHGFDPEWRPRGRGWATPRWRLAENLRKLAAVDWPPFHVRQLDARDVALAAMIRRLREDGRVVVYIDPPYQGTTGYGPGDLSREDVVGLALTAAEAGADVYVSEAAPVGELMLPGWRVVPLPGRGARAWKAGELSAKEWLTCSDA